MYMVYIFYQLPRVLCIITLAWNHGRFFFLGESGKRIKYFFRPSYNNAVYVFTQTKNWQNLLYFWLYSKKYITQRFTTPTNIVVMSSSIEYQNIVFKIKYHSWLTSTANIAVFLFCIRWKSRIWWNVLILFRWKKCTGWTKKSKKVFGMLTYLK